MNPACDPKQKFLNHLGCGTLVEEAFSCNLVIKVFQSCHWNHDCGSLAVESWISNTGSGHMAMKSWLRNLS